jgi:hypothetical protein
MRTATLARRRRSSTLWRGANSTAAPSITPVGTAPMPLASSEWSLPSQNGAQAAAT